MSQFHVAESQWLRQNSVDEEHLRKSLQKEQRILDEERHKLEREKEEFRILQRTEQERLKRESELFQMKWRILEEELQQLAKEKQEIQVEKEYCRRIKAENQRYAHAAPVVQGEMFFSGVDSELGMRKRYKDLIKIFHPDNRDGDTYTLQVINKEYDEMKKLFCV